MNKSAKYIALLFILLLRLPTFTLAEKSQNTFKAGECLDFKIYFEFILGGKSRMAVEGIEEVDGYPCYHIVSTARSTKTVDMFYKVRDKVETWRDVKGGFSRRYSKKLHEGRYKCDKRVEYFPDDSTAFLYRKLEAPAETLNVIGTVQDVLSAFYEFRTLDLRIGKSDWIDIHDINKRYDLEVRVLRRETIEVPAGKFKCFVIEPLLKSSGLFRKEGIMQIWLTDDEHRMPVLMKSKLYFGRVWAKLVKYKLGN